MLSRVIALSFVLVLQGCNSSDKKEAQPVGMSAPFSKHYSNGVRTLRLDQVSSLGKTKIFSICDPKITGCPPVVTTDEVAALKTAVEDDAPLPPGWVHIA